MTSLKTFLIAAALAVTPAAAMAQDAAPAATPAATTAPADAAAAAPAAAKAPDIAHALPTPGVGEPVPGGFTLQEQVTDIGHDAKWMHNVVLMPIITVITIFVLLLLVWTIVRYNRRSNPVPSKTSHNTLIEVIWTLAPVLILLVIAVPSIKLLAKQYAPPKADLTVKVIGNQWYWTYQYPDNGDFEIVSNMLKEKNEITGAERARTDADGPRLLAVDERLVVPAGAVVKLIVTSADVIHSFAVPAFWTKMDAVPGKLNETWFKVDRPGVYFGQCSELCGARHAYMPIAVEVVSKAQFAQWVASKGGTMPGAAPANPDATANSPITNATAGAATAGNAPSTPAVPAPPTAAVGAPAATSQGATANEGTQP
ncbi:cytochrome c oxidase subunit II [Sphingomonas sp. ID0503]|uniref:cytochrome c oxidase subunit II n=1 Tax=Sphingomonas sp. ID0503 TaxID=3399691 RepID=UPI003AFB43A8